MKIMIQIYKYQKERSRLPEHKKKKTTHNGNGFAPRPLMRDRVMADKLKLTKELIYGGGPGGRAPTEKKIVI